VRRHVSLQWGASGGFHVHSTLHYFSLNDAPTPEICTLSLHDALPISVKGAMGSWAGRSLPPGSKERSFRNSATPKVSTASRAERSEEHTSELQSRENLVCRLLLEKKKKDLYGSTPRPAA